MQGYIPSIFGQSVNFLRSNGRKFNSMLLCFLFVIISHDLIALYHFNVINDRCRYTVIQNEQSAVCLKVIQPV